jgi:hypothetical protein
LELVLMQRWPELPLLWLQLTAVDLQLRARQQPLLPRQVLLRLNRFCHMALRLQGPFLLRLLTLIKASAILAVPALLVRRRELMLVLPVVQWLRSIVSQSIANQFIASRSEQASCHLCLLLPPVLMQRRLGSFRMD